MALFTDNSPSIPLQVFTGKNYDFWSLRLKTYFDSQNLWNVVQNGASNLTNNALSEAERKTLEDRSEEERRKTLEEERETLEDMFEEERRKTLEDRSEAERKTLEDQNLSEQERKTLEDQSRQKDVQALFIIQQAVSDTIFIKIKDAKTAKEAWDILEKEFRSDEVPSDSYVITRPQHYIQQDPLIIDIVPADYQPSIYKVPDILREGNPEAYTPKLISIGPIHHGKSELRQMEQQKRTYLRFFQERLPSGSDNLNDYVDFLKNKEERIRRCYSEKYPQFNNYQFVNMILLDSVFIMEFFLRQSGMAEYPDDELISKWWRSIGIKVDLLLLENQIPIFVLKKLYDSYVPADSKRPQHSSFLDLARQYFWNYHPEDSPRQPRCFTDLARKCFKCCCSNESESSRQPHCFTDLGRKCFKWCCPKESKPSEEETELLDQEKFVKHFTDLNRCLMLPKNLPEVDDRGPFPIPKTAAKLMESGVSFKPVSDRPLLDIKFKTSCLSLLLCLGCFPGCSDCFKARIQFPKITVDHSTESILWNQIALEQCRYPRHRHVCCHVCFLSYLIHSKEDVELLVEKGVIVHHLSSNEELVTMISGLSKPIMVTSNYYYGKIMRALDDHYDSNCKRFMGAIRWVYFRDLLRTTTTLVGVLVLSIALINLLHNFRVI